ncbi:hypothetical protein [Burkholderia sp. PU8-34]
MRQKILVCMIVSAVSAPALAQNSVTLYVTTSLISGGARSGVVARRII